jgi:nucleolar complex protein 2
MNEDDQVLAWSIDSASGTSFYLCLGLDSLHISVYNKLVTTALRYTPIVLAHHAPYKTLDNGKLYVYFIMVFCF